MQKKLLYILAFVALFSNFLANQKPLLCSLEGKITAPIFQEIGVQFGISTWSKEQRLLNFEDGGWKSLDYDWAIFPPIPYSPKEEDAANKKVSPFSQQQATWRNRHWLGTDNSGRDVFAGLVSGTRVAFLVSLTVLGIAGSLGIFFGLLAGYYGDHRLKVGWLSLLLAFGGFCIGCFFAFVFFKKYGTLFLPISLFLAIILLCFLLGRLLDRLLSTKKYALPLDLFLMRTADILNAVPGLIIIGVAISLPETPPSLWALMTLIGFLSWPRFALFVRGEMLQIRSLAYMEAAQLSGLPDWKILLHHALPNAYTPALIALSMSTGSAILLEASLSFLGLSTDLDTVSWGQLLMDAKYYPKAWWLTLFPGLMIFITVRFFYQRGR